uniref:Nuclear pore complex protein n=1 Tax=Rhipicephalus pulchellus TaxID=72859 RepID=L7M2T4_RHIPC
MAQSDSFVLWSNVATPVTELRSRSRFSNRSASFSRQQQQDFGTPAASYTSTIAHASRNASAFAGGSIGDFATPGGSRPSRGGGSVSANFEAADMTAFSASALATEHPAVVATAGIYADFMEAYKAHRSSQDALTLIEKYANLCDSYLAKVRKVTERMVSRKGEQVWMEAMACQTVLTEERNTWKLTGALLRDRFKVDEFMEEGDDTMFVDGTREASDREIVDALMARDSFARQAQLVVDWLESCAAHQRGMSSDDDRLEYFADGGCAWENTLHHVQSRASAGSAPSSYVTELDPDAPSRQRLPIHDLDRDDECRLFRSVFFHLRAGQLQRAQELAADNGHHWLAAAVEGWRPYHDPNNGSVMGADAMQPAEGNLYRDLWKRACWEAASNPTCSLYERAVYGALSGNVQAMLPACTTWEDQLWARMRALVDVCVEQELRTATQQARSLEPLPPGYPSDRGTFEAVFRDLQAAVGASDTRDQEIMHILQRCVVLDDAVSMVEEMHDWATAQAMEPPLQTMRFLAHMILLLRQIGCETGTGACSALLRTYVDLLIDEGHVPLVATYAATLPATDQVAKYTQLLRSLKTRDPEEQELCLQLARSAGLNVTAITRTLVEQVRVSGEEPIELRATSAVPSMETTAEDEEKVASLEWLLIDNSTRGEALKQANALMRGFVCLGKIGAARKTFHKLPADSVRVAVEQWSRSSMHDGQLPAEDENAVREFLCFDALLKVHASFQEWFQQFHRRKPTPPEELAPGARFAEKLAHEHKVRSYTVELEHWQGLVTTLAKEVKRDVFDVLLFVDGGWMVDQKETPGSVDNARSRQMAALRRLCIPQLTFLLMEALEESGLAAEFTEVVDVIASEKQALYEEFGDEELRTLLQKSRAASIILLDQGLDALGFPLQ